jgi:hypothetical protein
MTAIDLTQIDSPAVAAYFEDIQMAGIQTDSPDILIDPPYLCQGCETRIVPWFEFCYECANDETCDHANADTLIGPDWTACATCGHILPELAGNPS